MKKFRVLLLNLALLCVCGGGASANVILVKHSSDALTSEGGFRYAIAHAASGDTIRFDPAHNWRADPIVLWTESLNITQSVCIEGNGAIILTLGPRIMNISGTNGASIHADVRISRMAFVQPTSLLSTDSLPKPMRVPDEEHPEKYPEVLNGTAICSQYNNGNLTLHSCLFLGNAVYGRGGALYYNGGGTLEVQACMFYLNYCIGWGGAIAYNASAVKIKGNLFCDNVSGDGVLGGKIGENGDNICNFTDVAATDSGYNVYNRANIVSIGADFSFTHPGSLQINKLPFIIPTIDGGSLSTLEAPVLVFNTTIANRLPDTLPSDYPRTDYYGCTIHAGGTSGAIQQRLPLSFGAIGNGSVSLVEAETEDSITVVVGSTVRIAAKPDAEFNLQGWDINGTRMDETGDTLTLVIRDSADVRAVFSPVPAVIAVTVTPDSIDVQKGTTQQFGVNVSVVSDAPQTVAWTMLGGHAGTSLSASGLLTVDENESDTALRVAATSTFDASKSDTVTVRLTDKPVPPAIISVGVAPKRAEVMQGNRLQLSATVLVQGGADTTVLWSLSSTRSSVDTTGLLTVFEDEPADTILVVATSRYDPAMADTARVAVRIRPYVFGVSVTPEHPTVMQGESLQFSASVTVQGAAETSVVWSVGGKSSRISSSGLLTLGEFEADSRLEVVAVSTFDATKADTATVEVMLKPYIFSVNVSSASPEVMQGRSVQFYANLAGQGGADLSVRWEVTGGGVGTSIDSTGLLTVADNESAQTLQVTAISNFDAAQTGFASIAVVPRPAIIGLSISPDTTSVQRGAKKIFTANLTAQGGISPALSWQLIGSTSAQTLLNMEASQAELLVADSELADTILVAVSADADITKRDTATVFVRGEHSVMVSFDSRGGTSVASVKVAAGNTLQPPASPTRAEYSFDGWYIDLACTVAWNFSTDVAASDMTLYAKWTPVNTFVNSNRHALLRIFPNPAGERLTVENEMLKAGDRIEIYSMDGILLHTFMAAGSLTGIDVSLLSHGTYVVKAGGRTAKFAK